MTTKISRQGLVVAALIAFAAVIVFGSAYVQNARSATGSSFDISSIFSFGQEATTTPDAFRFIAAGATTTVDIDLQGASDYRLNLMSHASTSDTAPDITIVVAQYGENGVDFYYDAPPSISGSVGTVPNYLNYSWTAATSTYTGGNPVVASSTEAARVSIPLTNPNAKKIRLEIGSTQATDLFIEVRKVIPVPR